jgi:hypothetical protein
MSKPGETCEKISNFFTGNGWKTHAEVYGEVYDDPINYRALAEDPDPRESNGASNDNNSTHTRGNTERNREIQRR